jgi:hypothetical protein
VGCGVVRELVQLPLVADRNNPAIRIYRGAEVLAVELVTP